MSVDAMIQTYLLDDSADAKKTFLNKFDKDGSDTIGSDLESAAI